MAKPSRPAAASKTRPARPRHVPQRTCVGCRSTAAKRGFVRVVRSSDGRVAVDLTGKAAGRGAYVCAQPSCWEVALKRGRLGQSLRVTITDDDRRALADYAAGLQPDDETAPGTTGGST